MVQKRSRPIEILTLLNPAFCGQTILHCINKYEKFHSKGIPFSLVFFILPIILHKETRSRIPSVTKSTFHYWLTNNSPILIDLSERIRKLVPFTKEALLFLSYHDTIKITNSRIKIKNFNPKTTDSDSIEIQECFKRAEVLGKWLAIAGTETTVYAMLGVTP